MSQRRCLSAVTRHAKSLLSSSSATTTLHHHHHHRHVLSSSSSPISLTSTNPTTHWPHHHHRLSFRNFSSSHHDDSDDESEGVEDSDEESGREYSLQEKEAEAAAIGYKVVGPLQPNEHVFKPHEPVFAVFQIGSHQFKVSNGDCIFVERLKFCEVNDKLILNKVLILGSTTQTIIGRPTLPNAAVHAVVEEHALDAKVIIFKKKRRKNYRRTKGHRQELTKLRITDIEGIEKPEKKIDPKSRKATVKKQEKFAVAA